jgi:UDP-glucose 6-dehydrogenase
LKSKFKNYKKLKILISGLTYKNNTNTLRGSEALQIYSWAKKECASCIAWEKKYDKLVDKDISNIEIYHDFYKAIRKSDILVVYRLPDEKIDFKFISKNIKSKTIIDCSNKIESKNLFDLDVIKIGR